MTDKIIDGKKISSEIREKIKKFGDLLKEQSGRTPGLAVVLVGENPASKVYVKNKAEKLKKLVLILLKLSLVRMYPRKNY